MIETMGNIKLLFLLIPLCLQAQTERDIKLSGNYYWGEGEHKSEEQARNMALQDMIFKIQVTVSSEVLAKEEEIDNQYSEEFRSAVRVSSTLSLQGIDFFRKTRKGNLVVVAYISKENYRKSIEAISKEISGLVTSIEIDEQLGNIGTLIEDYYIAYLRAFQCPEPVKFTTADGKKYPNIQMFLKNKIETWLTCLKITPGKVTIDASIPMVTIPVSITDNGKPVGNIIVRLNTQDGADMEVIDGKTQFFLYMLPSAFQENIDVILAINLNRKKTKDDLYHLHESFKVTHSKNVSLDYSGLIKIGFNVYPQVSGALLFKPVYTNLSISDLTWDFGEGESSSQQNPLHNYADKNDHIVTLTFNNNPELMVKKRVSADGKVVDISKEKEPPVNVDKKKSLVLELNSPVLEDLVKANDYDKLAKKLKTYKKRHKLIYGKENTFVKPENCYIFIIHPRSKIVVAVLDKGKDERRNLKTGEMISDLSVHYRGMISIYTEVY